MPVWLDRIELGDVWRNEEMTFEQRRDVVVSRLRESDWFKCYEEAGEGELLSVVEELADAVDFEDFNYPWNYIYDIADADRVWIATF